MRRAASVGALTVAALASIATEAASRSVSFAVDPVLVWVDPNDPEPLVLRLDAALDRSARQRAEITDGWVQISASWPDGLWPDRPVEVVATARDGTSLQGGDGSFDAACTTDDCEALVEIGVEPRGSPPFPVQVLASATVRVSHAEDARDVDGELTLSGAVEVVGAAIPYDKGAITIDPMVSPRLVARLEASLAATAPEGARLRGASVFVVASGDDEAERDGLRVLLSGPPDEAATETSSMRYFASCTVDPCVLTVEIAFEAPEGAGPFVVWIGRSAEIWADASVDPAEVSATLTIAEPAE